MKTLLFTLFTCLITYNCIAQKNHWLKNLPQNSEPGKCYFTTQLPQSDTSSQAKDSIYWEVLPPIYQQKLTTLGQLVSEKELKQPIITIEIKAPTTQYVKPNYDDSRYSKSYRAHLKYQTKGKTIICLQEVSARYSSIRPSPNDTNLQDLVIVQKKVIRGGKIQRISKEEAQVTQNPVLVLPPNSSEWSELLFGTYCPAFSIISIQEALVKNGYDCPTDGILNAETRKALIQFQKDNNLPEGRLDIETLRKLGVE